MRKTHKKILIIVATLIILFVAVQLFKLFTLMIKYPSVASGKNIVVSGKSRGSELFVSYYSTIEEAYNKGNGGSGKKYEDIKNIISHDEYKNATIILYQNDGSINSGEFITKEKNGSKVFQYVGGKSVIFAGKHINENSNVDATIRSDLSNDLSIGTFWVDLKKMYGRLPAWGVSDSNDIYNLKIENQPIDSIYEVKYEDKTYYVWYFKDLQTEKSAKDVDINL